MPINVVMIIINTDNNLWWHYCKARKHVIKFEMYCSISTQMLHDIRYIFGVIK